VVALGNTPVALGTDMIGKHVALRFDGSMMDVIHGGLLVIHHSGSGGDSIL